YHVLAAEKAFGGCPRDKPRVFQFKVGALNLAFVHAELLCERGGRGQRRARAELSVAYARFDLHPHLQIDGAFRQRFQLNIHARHTLGSFCACSLNQFTLTQQPRACDSRAASRTSWLRWPSAKVAA